MPWDIVWRPAAEQDLTTCAAHIAADNIEAALRFIDEVEVTVNSLADSPLLGTEMSFAHPDLAGLRRRVVSQRFRNYLLFYRAITPTRTVELIRILHGARELPPVLLNED